MELQGINRYPVLNPAGRKLAPVQFVRAQPQDMQPHYVAFGTQNATFQAPPQNDALKPGPLYRCPPNMIPRSQNIDFAPTSQPNGQIYPQIYQNAGNFYMVPQQHPVQMPMNYSPEGYYVPNPGYYVQHNASNEYFNEAAHPMTFTQQPDNQPALPERYTELDNEAEKFKNISHVFKGMLILTGLAVIGLTIAVLFGMTQTSPCSLIGRRDTRWCSDSGKFMAREKGLLAILLVLACIANVFYKFALRAYLQRRAKAMNVLFYVFAFFFVMSILSFNPVTLLFYGYLTRTTQKLRKIFFEMEAIKAQGGEPKLSETTTSY
eukprot:CAMPEP_0176446000 /NCGR_PEP_ID=MMETSP0127-20121128/24059_1 /TAXON_ID=938130 /ORGANISM="Platyophrya macrostoma, Strain WH" /LENGTH=319 /DNA_ID=CAMNT_0017831939 /DNA_START=42 /DNA_END=1001 /DNA_ORIENTATION=+